MNDDFHFIHLGTYYQLFTTIHKYFFTIIYFFYKDMMIE